VLLLVLLMLLMLLMLLLVLLMLLMLLLVLLLLLMLLVLLMVMLLLLVLLLLLLLLVSYVKPSLFGWRLQGTEGTKMSSKWRQDWTCTAEEVIRQRNEALGLLVEVVSAAKATGLHFPAAELYLDNMRAEERITELEISSEDVRIHQKLLQAVNQLLKDVRELKE
jgi:hypothetical protein